MVDLETLGTGYRALIVSIGAVVFTPGERGHTNAFAVNIDPSSAQGAGLNIDADTVMWWMHQSQQARDALVTGELFTLRQALGGFAEWLPKGAKVWGNGSNFDNRILREAYEAVGMKCPWHFRDDRDMRTFMAMHPQVRLTREGGHHVAVHDAIFQVQCMAEAVRAKGAAEEGVDDICLFIEAAEKKAPKEKKG